VLAAALMVPSVAGAQAVAPPPVRADDTHAGLTVPAQPTVAVATPVKAKHAHTKGDPLEGLNRGLFSIHQFLDRLIFRPVAMAYKKIIPKVVRSGVRHFFSNIGEPIVFVNDIIQLKPKRAVRTLGRFTVNSTIGVGGLVDVAKTKGFDLPHHDNGFGNTLGRYGIGPGPYLFLPFVGPTDFRDLGSGPVDGLVLPASVGFFFDQARYQITQGVVAGLDQRAEADGDLKVLLDGAVDPYATLRSAFLQTRAATIYELRHGEGKTASPLDDPLNDPMADPAKPFAAGDTPADPQAPPPNAIDPTAAQPAPATGDPLADPLSDPAVKAPTTQPAPAPATGDPLADPLQDGAYARAGSFEPLGGPSSAGSKISAHTSVHASEIIRILPMLAVPGCADSHRLPNALPVASAENSTARARLDCSRSVAPARHAITK
jgi:phospholipid-binding lipoprotein MlaA